MSNTEGILKTNSTPVQVYERVGGARSSLMARAFVAKAGSYLRVGETTSMSYDHKDHQVVPLLNAGMPGKFFVMKSDADQATVVNEEVRQS